MLIRLLPVLFVKLEAGPWRRSFGPWERSGRERGISRMSTFRPHSLIPGSLDLKFPVHSQLLTYVDRTELTLLLDPSSSSFLISLVAGSFAGGNVSVSA